MVREIREDRTWWGASRQRVYDDNELVYEIRKETTWTGKTRDVVTTPGGDRIFEIEHRKTVSGKPYSEVRSVEGSRVATVWDETSISGKPYRRIEGEDGTTLGRVTPSGKRRWQIDEVSRADRNPDASSYESGTASTEQRAEGCAYVGFGAMGGIFLGALLLALYAFVMNLQRYTPSAEPTDSSRQIAAPRIEWPSEPTGQPSQDPSTGPSPNKPPENKTPPISSQPSQPVVERVIGEQPGATLRISLENLPVSTTVTLFSRDKAIFTTTAGMASPVGQVRVSTQDRSILFVVIVPGFPVERDQLWVPVLLRDGDDLLTRVSLDGSLRRGHRLRIRFERQTGSTTDPIAEH